ncbi:retrovirus-related pol polyprotein from transposon TNT 1-94 [Tanacetum coccineum]
MVTDPPPTGSTIVPAPRKKLDSEFNDKENKLELADTQAEIILSQELLMQGSGRTLQQRKEDLFDEYERFRAIGNESIHDYFVRFHKLVNDMKITQLEIPTHQMNTKFVNNLPAYWGKYVTNVKQNMDISTTPYVQIYTHLKAYEPHAKKTLKKQEQSTSIVDPLAYVAHTTSAPALSSPSTPSPQPTAQSPNDALMATMTQIANLLSGFQKQFPPTNNQLRTSSNSRTHATVHDGHIVTEPVQRKAPGNVGNTGARGKKVICYNCRGEGHVARQCKEPKRKMDSQYFKDKALLMEAKEKGDVLDAEAEAFLADVECTAPYDQPQALTTTNMFQANHEDAYDSDVDEGPNAAVAFMANLSSTSATNNPVNEVHSNDNQIFDNVDYQIQEMHQEEHLDSDAETEIDDNTIPYHQYLLDTEAQNVPTEVSADTSDKVSMIAILTDLQTQLDGHAKVNQEKCLEIETLKNELLQCKQEICRLDTHKVKLDLENKVRQEQALVIQRNKRNAELVQENDLLKSTLSGKEKSIAFLQSEKEKILSEKKDLADSYLDEIVCLKNANKVARDMLQRFNMPTQTIPMLSKKPKAATADLHKDLLGTRNPGLGYMAKRAQPVLYDADTLLHPNHHPVSIWDSEEVLVHQVVSMKKMNEKPGHVRPENGFYEKLNALKFVPQQELSREQAYWLPANEIASQASKWRFGGRAFVMARLELVKECHARLARAWFCLVRTGLVLGGNKLGRKFWDRAVWKLYGGVGVCHHNIYVSCAALQEKILKILLHAVFRVLNVRFSLKMHIRLENVKSDKRRYAELSNLSIGEYELLYGWGYLDIAQLEYASLSWAITDCFVMEVLEVAFLGRHSCVTSATTDIMVRSTLKQKPSSTDIVYGFLASFRLNHPEFPGTLICIDLWKYLVIEGLPMLKFDKDFCVPSCQLGFVQINSGVNSPAGTCFCGMHRECQYGSAAPKTVISEGASVQVTVKPLGLINIPSYRDTSDSRFVFETTDLDHV